jgi:hypothetical protein
VKRTCGDGLVKTDDEREGNIYRGARKHESGKSERGDETNKVLFKTTLSRNDSSLPIELFEHR